MSRKHLYLCIYLSCFATFLIAQNKKKHYSLSGGGFHVPKFSETFTRDFEFRGLNIINDSTGVNNLQRGTFVTTNVVQSHFGYYGEAKTHFDFKRSSLTVGLGISFTRHEQIQISDILNLQIIHLDTIPFFVPNNNNPQQPCDSFENSFRDFNDGNPFPLLFRRTDIYLPIRYHYQLVPNKISLYAGLHIQSSFLIQTHRNINIERTELKDDHISCKFVLVETDLNVSEFLDNFLLKWDAGINLHVTPKWSFDLGVNQTAFAYQTLGLLTSSVVLNIWDWYRPLHFTAGVSYHFDVNW